MSWYLTLFHYLKKSVKEDPNQLSENVSEWRQNLAKSWLQFKDFFVTVRTREDMVVAPFLSEQERHLVKQRLKFIFSTSARCDINQTK